MVAVPVFFADTVVVLPDLDDTLRTSGLELVHFPDETLPVSVCVLPSVISVLPVIFNSGAETVTLHFAVFFEPSLAFAVMVALPADTAVTLPVLETFATFGLLLLQLIFLLVALVGLTVAFKTKDVFPADASTFSFSSFLFNVIPLTF